MLCLTPQIQYMNPQILCLTAEMQDINSQMVCLTAQMQYLGSQMLCLTAQMQYLSSQMLCLMAEMQDVNSQMLCLTPEVQYLNYVPPLECNISTTSHHPNATSQHWSAIFPLKCYISTLKTLDHVVLHEESFYNSVVGFLPLCIQVLSINLLYILHTLCTHGAHTKHTTKYL